MYQGQQQACKSIYQGSKGSTLNLTGWRRVAGLGDGKFVGNYIFTYLTVCMCNIEYTWLHFPFERQKSSLL
jgi:hypothetical protein